MKKINKEKFIPLLLAVLLVIGLTVSTMPSVSIAAQSTVNLGTADTFAILAASAITVAGEEDSTTIYGDIGVYPNAAYTGEENVVQTGGAVYLANEVAQKAQEDLSTAYIDAETRVGATEILTELGNQHLTPGVYNSADGTFALTGVLTLYADNPNDAFIFQMDSTLTTASASRIVLEGEATFCRIFWQVGSSATLGADSLFVGHILAYTDISVGTGTEVIGQLLALGGGGVGGAVTLAGSDTITNDLCLTPGSLRVTKEVQGPVNNMTLPDFEITLTGGPYDFTDTKTIEAGVPYTWEGLASGTYQVSEGELSQEWNVDGTGQYVVQIGETTEVTITNSYVPDEDDDYNSGETDYYGRLTVTKVISGAISTMTLPLFEITVTGPYNFNDTRTIIAGVPYTWEGLVPGVYTVTESRSGLSREWTVSGEGTIRVTADQNARTTITNAYNPAEEENHGELTVTKVVSGVIGTMTLPLFEITITGPEGFSATRTFVHGETYTWEGLVPGRYTVTESRRGLNSEWTVSGESTISVTADQNVRTTITNSYEKEIVRDIDVVRDIDAVRDTAYEAELPKTGGNALWMNYSALVLLGTGMLIWRKRK